MLRQGTEGPNWIDLRVADGTEVGPVITKIEHVDELLTQPEAREIEAPLVQKSIVKVDIDVSYADPSSITEPELVGHVA